MDNIIVYDDFLDNITMNKVIAQTVSSRKWEFGHKSANNVYDSPFWILDLNDNILFSKVIKSKIEAATKMKFKLDRVYANGQLFGQNGSFHKDNENTNSYTFCLYVLPELPNPIEIVLGELQFKLDSFPSYSFLGIETKHNRGVFFPSDYIHRGMSFSRYINYLRCCVAWKFTLTDT